MFKRLRNAITPSKGKSLAGSFSRLGWAGFWLQLVFGPLPILVAVICFAFSPTKQESAGEFGFMECLAIINILILFFTIYWSFRYTRVGRRIRDPERRPSESYLVGTVWTGVAATTVGMLFSMIAILIETAGLLFIFLKSPQGGVPVIQTSGAASPYWVSTIDIVSLMALVLFLFAELIVLVFSLWLLFRTTLGSPESPPASAPGAAGAGGEVRPQGETGGSPSAPAVQG
jgi:hypothetical protein